MSSYIGNIIFGNFVGVFFLFLFIIFVDDVVGFDRF